MTDGFATNTAEALYLRKWESDEARQRGDLPNEIVLVREERIGEEVTLKRVVLTHPADIRIAEADAKTYGIDLMRSS